MSWAKVTNVLLPTQYFVAREATYEIIFRDHKSTETEGCELRRIRLSFKRWVNYLHLRIIIIITQVRQVMCRTVFVCIFLQHRSSEIDNRRSSSGRDARRRVPCVNRRPVVYGRYRVLATTRRGGGALVGTYAHASARESAQGTRLRVRR